MSGWETVYVLILWVRQLRSLAHFLFENVMAGSLNWSPGLSVVPTSTPLPPQTVSTGGRWAPLSSGESDVIHNLHSSRLQVLILTLTPTLFCSQLRYY